MDPRGEDAPDVLTLDRPCVHCQYNLRGLSTLGKCPECGGAVADSLRADLLLDADRKWLRQLRRGVLAITISCILWVVAVVLGGLAQGLGWATLIAVAFGIQPATWNLWLARMFGLLSWWRFDPVAAFSAGLILVAAALRIWGTWQMASRPVGLRDPRRALRRWLRGLALTHALFLLFLAAPGLRLWLFLFFSGWLMLGFVLAEVLAVFFFWTYFRHLARLGPQPYLAWVSSGVRWVSSLGVALVFVGGFAALVFSGDYPSTIETIILYVFIFGDVALVGLSGIAGFALLWSFSRWLGRISVPPARGSEAAAEFNQRTHLSDQTPESGH